MKFKTLSRRSHWMLFSLALLFAPQNGNAETIEEFLRAFHDNPVMMMQRLPSVVDDQGHAKPRGYINESLVSEQLKERSRIRDKIMGLSKQTPVMTAAPMDKGEETKYPDFAELLVEPDKPLLRNLREMESKGLTSHSVSVTPWTDSYWPMYKGLIATRYADPSYPNSSSFVVNRQYALSNPPSAIVGSGNLSAINRLSPAEKYDFLVGDYNFTLSNYSWNQGQKHQNSTGFVAKWMGICHGWAAAAHMNAKIPDAPVVAKASNGTPVTFYPQDIKALQSILWANASPGNSSPESRFIGNRCDTVRPRKSAYGRVINQGCFDTNPATWHLSVVNQAGANDRSFVFDSTYDYQVWNFPLAKFQYRYFNPQTFQEGPTLSASAIPIARFRVDKFPEFRAPGTKYVVGVYMDVSHVNAITPTRRGRVEAPLKTIRLVYDLELDENMNILGGEWYSNAHPDFLWTFTKDAQANASEDSYIQSDNWLLNAPIPADWAQYAKRASARGEPLYSVISRLTSEGTETGPHEGENDEGGEPVDVAPEDEES